MTINDATIQVERTKSYAPNRVPSRRMITIGATVVVVAIVTMVAFVQNSGRESVPPARQPAPQSQDAIVRDLVDRGLVPSQALHTAPQSQDAIVRDLVDRGLVPSQALHTAPQSQDAIVQDLVDRGLVPSQALHTAPQSQDAIVQDLVDRGLVPAAALDD